MNQHHGKEVPISQAFSQRVENKLSKLDKFFDSDAQAEVTVSQERSMERVEVTIRHGGMFFRAEETAAKASNALDKLIDVLFRQIRRNKTRLEKRLRVNAFGDNSVWENGDGGDEEIHIVKSKKFPVKPMDVEEAILQMNMLGHQFYMFRNMDSNEINVVYCRRDGNYGLLEPDI